MTLKYIRFKHDAFIIFDQYFSHDEVCRSKEKEIVSAGFCDLQGKSGEVIASCYGKSDSLGIKSRPEDSEKMTTFINEERY
jgi:hypothetical protein